MEMILLVCGGLFITVLFCILCSLCIYKYCVEAPSNAPDSNPKPEISQQETDMSRNRGISASQFSQTTVTAISSVPATINIDPLPIVTASIPTYSRTSFSHQSPQHFPNNRPKYRPHTVDLSVSNNNNNLPHFNAHARSSTINPRLSTQLTAPPMCKPMARSLSASQHGLAPPINNGGNMIFMNYNNDKESSHSRSSQFMVDKRHSFLGPELSINAINELEGSIHGSVSHNNLHHIHPPEGSVNGMSDCDRDEYLSQQQQPFSLHDDDIKSELPLSPPEHKDDVFNIYHPKNIPDILDDKDSDTASDLFINPTETRTPYGDTAGNTPNPSLTGGNTHTVLV